MNDEFINENEKVLVSIIIATFNAGKNISDCLDSIINQQEKKIEIILVDGGSKDNTITIIKKLNKKNITWVSEPDKGIYDALNKGAKMAKGRWLYFMGTDDRLLAGFSQMTTMLKNINTVYYGNTEPFYDTDDKPDYELLTGRFNNYRLAKYCINHQAILYPSGIFKKYKYDIKYKVFADYALNLKVWGDVNFKKIYYPIDIARYNMTGFSSTVTDTKFIKDKPALIRKNLGWFVYARFLLKRLKKKLRNEKF